MTAIATPLPTCPDCGQTPPWHHPNCPRLSGNAPAYPGGTSGNGYVPKGKQ